jgi:PAS domain S-box-containing protein
LRPTPTPEPATARLGLAARYASDIIFLLSPDGRVLEANDRALAAYGYTLDELRQLPPSGLRPPEALSRAPDDLALLRQTDGGYETVHRRKDGTTFPVEVRGRAIEVDGTTFLVGIIRDITERQERDREIARLTRFYAALSQVNQTIVRAASRDELFEGVCRSLVEQAGFRMAWVGWRNPATQEVVPVTVYGDAGGYVAGIRVYADDRPEGRGPTGTAIREGRPYVCSDFANDPRTAPWREAAARHGFRASIGLPIREAGVVAGALTVYASEAGYFGDREVALLEEAVSDIDFGLDHLTKEARIRVSEARYRMAQSIGHVGSWEYDLQTAEFWGSDEAKRIYGFDPRQRSFTTAEVEACIPERDRVHQALVDLIEHGTPYDLEFEILPRGASAPKLITSVAQVQRDEHGRPRKVTGVIHDVTERRRADQQIREQAALLDGANDAIFVHDPAGVITYWNEGAERLYGWKRTEAVGRSVAELLPAGDLADQIEAALRQDGHWSGELRQIRKNGEAAIVFSHFTRMDDRSGRPKSVFAINTDVTEKKQLEARYLQSQRLESLGSLASGIAHDLNNVLAPISLGAPLLRPALGSEADRQILSTIEASARRGADIVRQVLVFARGMEGKFVPTEIRHVLRDVAEIATETFPRNIAITTDVPKNLWPVVGDATHLHQILINLCVNARDAMPEGGQLTLAAANVVLDESCGTLSPEAKPGPHIHIRVTDTGVGIPAEHARKIFDPFFTTKPVGKGTGLGLPTVLGLVKQHGGFVLFTSRVGHGTCFEVYLPAAPGVQASTAAEELTELPRGDGVGVLLVDDEAAIRSVATTILEERGYRVRTAAEGAAALRVLAQHRSEIAVVVTDMLMPGMDGTALLRELHRIDPSLRVVGMTGVGEAPGATDSPAVSALIMKPFTVRTLVCTLHDVLQPPPA